MAVRNYFPNPINRHKEQKRFKIMRLWVVLMKFISPLAALAILGLIFFWPKFQTVDSAKSTKDVTEISRIKNELSNKVQHPRMKSLNEKRKPYMLRAVTATQNQTDNQNNKDMELNGKLDRPSGEMELDDGSTLLFTADRGHFSQKGRKLHLYGNVHITTSKGYDFKTASAAFDFSQNIGEGHEPVKGIGPTQEQIEAQGFKITGKGDDILFTGQTRLTLYTK